jgi:Rhs element Vgr protein
MPAPSLISGDTTLVTFDIKVNGTAISDAIQITSIEVNREINKIPTAKLQIADGGPAQANPFEVSDSADFVPGAEIEINAGYVATNELIFKGIIIKHSLKIKKGGGSVILIEAKHKAVKLTIGRKNKIHLDKKDSDAITGILQESGINKEVDATELQHPELVQHYATDWDFVLTRADANGLIAIPKLDKIAVKKPDFAASAKYEVLYGASMTAFHAEMDARTQLDKVTAVSWDSGDQALLEAQGNPPDAIALGNLDRKKLSEVIGLSNYRLQSAGQLTQTDLDQWSSARLLRSEIARVRGTVSFRGVANLDPGDILELAGLSERFNGKAFVGGLTHKISKGDWTTEAVIGLPSASYTEETPLIEAPSTAGVIPAFKGLTTGVVTKLEEDKEGNFRIKVKIPTLSDSDVVSARLGTFYASNEFGAFFYPEIGDEVIIGFLNEDPRYPIVLGSVYNKKMPTPISPKDDNHEKAIITRSKIKIHFDDDKKILTIETPAKNTMILDDDAKSIKIEDCNGNKIEMSDAGIKIESPKDITMKAQNIKSTADMAIEQKAGTDLKGEGLNVKLKASVQFGAEGAMAEVKGSGQTTIKGGIVMIN